jgi:hypothetical protein
VFKNGARSAADPEFIIMGTPEFDIVKADFIEQVFSNKGARVWYFVPIDHFGKEFMVLVVVVGVCDGFLMESLDVAERFDVAIADVYVRVSFKQSAKPRQ